MNSRERISAALSGHAVDHVPFCPFLAYVWDFFPESVRSRGQLAFHQMMGADPALTASLVTVLARKLSLRLRVVSARLGEKK